MYPSSQNEPSRPHLLALFSLSMIMLLLAMWYRMGPEMADDGAFFLRYAQNMLKGEFWVWNLGEAPVWGASAPLYPLLIALPMMLGVSPEMSLIAVGLALSSVSLACVATMLGHRFGLVAGLAFLAFSILDSNLMYFASGGLETPLTIAILAAGLWTLLYGANGFVVGLVAGLLAVNKLDLVPVGGLLVLAHWLQTRRFPWLAVVVAGAVSLAWYGFALWYFGAPVPNSFLTKSLYQNDLPKNIDWTWFGGFLFLLGIHKWLTLFSVIAIWRIRRENLGQLVYLGGIVAVHTIAYTIKFPFEPYNWYAMPALMALLVGAALGFQALVDLLPNGVLRYKLSLRDYAAIVLMGLVVVTTFRTERLYTFGIRSFVIHQETDRAEAGRWVAQHVPENFVVYTMWGNPAYHSQRKVLDGSFLNRRFETDDLILKYRPEILILQNNPGSTPEKPIFAATHGSPEDAGYKIVKVFGKSYAAGMDYFFAVLARDDIAASVNETNASKNSVP